jgi:hypothetical protein
MISELVVDPITSSIIVVIQKETPRMSAESSLPIPSTNLVLWEDNSIIYTTVETDK